MGYLYLDNSDKTRYGSLLKGADAHFVTQKDPKEAHQYPQDLMHAQQILRNHRYDPEYKNKKKKQCKERSEDKNSKDSDKPKLSFAQMVCSLCYCCGKNHKLKNCPDRWTKARSDW